MATPTSDAEARIIVQTVAWGYVPLPATHPGVQRAKARLLDPLTIPWDVLAEIAALAGHDADDLIVVGGQACPMLTHVHDALLRQAVARVRTR